MDRWKRHFLQLDPHAASDGVLELQGEWPAGAEPALDRPVVLRARREATPTAAMLKDLVTSLGPKFEVQTADTVTGDDGPLWTLSQWERYWRLRASSSAAADSALTAGAQHSSLEDEADSSSVARLAAKGPAAVPLPPGARGMALEVPCLSLDASPLEDRWPVPAPAASADLCGQVWEAEDGAGPAATPSLHLSPPGGCSLPALPPSAAAVWWRALAGPQSALLVAPGRRAWALAAGRPPPRADEVAGFCALALDGLGWLAASAAPEGAISLRGAFLCASAVATHLAARRLQDAARRVSPARQFPLFKQTLWRAAVVWGERLCAAAGLGAGQVADRLQATRAAWQRERELAKRAAAAAPARQGAGGVVSPDRRRRAVVLKDSSDEDVVGRNDETEEPAKAPKEEPHELDGPTHGATPVGAHRRLTKKRQTATPSGRIKAQIKAPAGSSGAPPAPAVAEKAAAKSPAVRRPAAVAVLKRKRAAHDDFVVSDDGDSAASVASDAEWGPAAAAHGSESEVDTDRVSGADSAPARAPRRLSTRQKAMLRVKEPWTATLYGVDEPQAEQASPEPPARSARARAGRTRRLPARLADAALDLAGEEMDEELEALEVEESEAPPSGGSASSVQGGGWSSGDDPPPPVVRIRLAAPSGPPTPTIPQVDGALGDKDQAGSPSGNEMLDGMYKELFGDEDEGGRESEGDHGQTSANDKGLAAGQSRAARASSVEDEAMRPALAALLEALREWLESASLLNDVPLTMDDPWAVAATLEVGMRALGWALTPPRLPFAEGLEATSDDAVLLEAARRYDARSPGKVLPHDGPSSSGDAPSLAEEQGEVESVSDYVPDEDDFIVERADATAYEEEESGHRAPPPQAKALAIEKRPAPGPVALPRGAPSAGGKSRTAATPAPAKKPGMSVKARLLKKLRI
ncbi:hypothetical protein QBZ16_004430 [Prototheca wickerhamii]|uniref:Uncharacterized protein n=1 Tax=Prototheca wickerhamii TaxID=3111 RepID=A0AAD9IJ49_PROWI|nr:hypothetical protein QBZ16_004430 [Prototheca wickerhamii]